MSCYLFSSQSVRRSGESVHDRIMHAFKIDMHELSKAALNKIRVSFVLCVCTMTKQLLLDKVVLALPYYKQAQGRGMV